MPQHAAAPGRWLLLPKGARQRSLPPQPAPPRAALPTLILFKGGKPADRIEGVMMGQDLRARLEYQLAH